MITNGDDLRDLLSSHCSHYLTVNHTKSNKRMNWYNYNVIIDPRMIALNIVLSVFIESITYINI